jgi:hypothetical protein
MSFRRRLFSTIINTNKTNNAPSCSNCLHHNMEKMTCNVNLESPIDSNNFRTNDLITNCGEEGKYYKYYGPKMEQENKIILRNFGLSGTSLIFCNFFNVYSLYPPVSMIVSTIPIFLTGIYGLLFVEQSYYYNKMENEENARLTKTNNK